MPSGVFTANAAWLVLAVIAFNLTRAAGLSPAPTSRGRHRDLRRKLVHLHAGSRSGRLTAPA